MDRRRVICIEVVVNSRLRKADLYVVRTNPRTGGATKRMYRTDALRLFRLLSEASARSSAAEAYGGEVKDGRHLGMAC